MAADPRSIFRTDAVQRYAAGRDQAVQLQIVRPRMIGLLWGALVLLVVGFAVLCVVRIPSRTGDAEASSRSVLSLFTSSAEN